MKVVWDWKEGFNKEKPKYHPNRNLLSDSTKSSVASWGKAIANTQTPPPTAYPSPHASNTRTSTSTVGQSPFILREYKVKQHYRVIYADVGESLAYATRLSDAIKAFEDVFVGEFRRVRYKGAVSNMFSVDAIVFGSLGASRYK
jgi:hypothetical protein